MPKDTASETQAGWVTPAPAPDRTDPGPTRIASRYTIEAQLGVGGMGTVYRVRDHDLDEVVALKMLRPELAGRPGLAARFRQEVKLARRVTHPNVVRTFDLGEFAGPDGSPRLFLTMEYVEGRSLSRILAEDGPLSPSRATPLVLGICAGLQAAHDAKVLHRDLKPDNVLVDGTGRAVLTDFGIARAGVHEGLAAQTTAGVIGTPAYMAPEQARSGAAVDHRVDLYSLGAMLFEVVTGRRAWDAADPFEIAVSRATSAPPDPRAVRLDVPEPVAQVIVRCMAPDPEARYPSARAVAEAWSAAVAVGPAAPTPIPATPIEAPFERAGTLAVLPFAAADPADRPIAEGLSEELVDAFSMTRGLKVRPLGSQRQAALTADARDVGRALGVSVVVEGRIRRAGDRFKVTVRCVSVADGFQLGAWRFESEDPMSIADEAAGTVAKALTVDLDVPTRGPSNPVASELYLRGKRELRSNWYRPEEACRLLAEACRLAPDDASVVAEYACAVGRYAMFGDQRTPATIEQARDLAERAVTLGPDRGECWFALAVARTAANDPTGTAAACKAALVRSPGHVQAQETLGMLLLEAGAIDEAITRLRSVLSPDRDSRVPPELARACAMLGRWDEALALLQSMPVLGAAITWSRFHLWRPDFPRPPELPPMPPLGPAPQAIPWLLRGLSVRVHDGVFTEDDLQQLFTYPSTGRIRATSMQWSTEVFAFLGRPRDAIRALELSVEAGLMDRSWLEHCPLLQRLTGEPEFADLRTIVTDRADRVLAAARA